MVGLGCPGEETIFAFVEGRLDAPTVANVESHTAACALCQDLLAAAFATGTHGRAAATPREDARAEDGEVLARGAAIGRYTILASVGKGGMGEVYAAYDPELDRKVALKLLRAKSDLDPARAHARLLREAKALARLSHPNVVAVHDVGTFDGRVFIAMVFVDGVTLKDWLAESARPQGEILAVFAAAARGLAAAHAVGLVHRDFKPGNVMVGRDGSVRVMDFGLARRLADPDDDGRDDAPGPAPPDLRLTQTGEVLGTPHYMAPEQFAGGPIDARTDQFSFCVALHRALYGVAPFQGDTIESLAASVLGGRLEPAPPRSNVPLWLRRAVTRGLAVDPAARWPGMNELIAALERDRARARRRRGLVAGVLALVGLSIFTLARGVRPTASLCLGGPARLAAIWEDAATPGTHPKRDAVERAFLASGAPGARDVWERIAALLDRYRAAWLTTYREACEATNVRRAETPALLDLRMSCLDERRIALSALTNVLATADRDVVKSAVDAAHALPSLERCADRRQLEASVEPPPDEPTRRRVDALRDRAAVAKALNDTGKHKQAGEMARAHVAEARAIGYRPLLAEMLVAFSRTFNVYNFDPQVVPFCEEAVWTSLAAGRDDLAAEAAIGLVGLGNGTAWRIEVARAWARLSEAILDRRGVDDPVLRSWLLQNEGLIELRHGGQDVGLELTRRALALKERALPPNHPDLATSVNDEAESFASMRRYDDALRANARAYDIYVRAYGPASMEAAMARSNQGEYLVDAGRAAEALDPLRRALSTWEVQVGPEHPALAFPLTALGRGLLQLARPKEAVPPLARALRLREGHELDPLVTAETRFALARALWESNGDRRRARELARSAGAAYAAAADVEHGSEVDAWLLGHGGAPDRRRVTAPPPSP